MKKRLVQTLTQDGNTYGQVSHPDDLMKAQDFLHTRITDLAHDFLNNFKTQEVTGFSYELGGGNEFIIAIKTPGRVYAQAGQSYELLADAELEIAAADEDDPRLDLVVAVLEDDIESELELIPFVRLRTADEFSAGTPAYPPANINAPTELHSRATIQIKTGEPAAIPSPPVVNANEVPLYLIAIAPGATELRDADVLDLREIVFTVRKLNTLVGKNTIDIASLLRRVQAVEALVDRPIDLSHVFGAIRTLGDILASLQLQLNAVRDLPEIRYPNPKLPLTNPATSQIPASGNTSDDFVAVPVVDVEIGGVINFGDRDIILRPEKFVDQSLRPHLRKVAANPETEKLETAITLAGVTQIAADGATDFVQKASEFLASRSRPGCAARDSQFIEIFGGLASDNSTELSDWLTYDALNDTLTPRDPLVALPEAGRPAMMPYGDGTNVLLICGTKTTVEPRCFKLNADTGGATEIMTTKPTGIQFFGDLYSAGKIFIVALRKEITGFEVDFWEFDTATDTFTELGVTGSVPEFALDSAGGCLYSSGKFLLVKFTPGVSSSGQTYLFDRGSSQWTELAIAGPYGDTAEKQLPLARFKLANVNGRPLLIGGLLTKETDAENARVWELQTSTNSFAADLRQWKSWDASFPPVQDPGYCSLIQSGFAKGNAIFFAGQGKFSNSKKRIFESVQAGLIATEFAGEPAISIADGSTFAQFVVPVHVAPWTVAGYLLTLIGEYADGKTVKAEVSFDGVNYHPAAINKLMLVDDSATPGTRYLRITLFNLKSSKPIISKMIEIFDENGVDLETRIILRYDAPNVVKALYVDREGDITLSAAIEPSTPDKCLLHKITPDGSNAPVIKNYINRRRPHIKYTDTEPAVSFDNELAVPARFVDARAYSSVDQKVYQIAVPAVDFDAVINVAGVSGGDGWMVEVEG